MTTQNSTLDQFRDRNENGSHTVYQDYKKTDHELFRKIPQGWNIFKLKQISGVFPSNVDKKEKDEEPTIRLCNYTEVYNNSEITPDLDFMKATAKESEIQKFRLEKGDVIITKDSESWDDIGVPAHIEQTMDDVICGYHLAHLKPYRSSIRGKYLYYFLASEIGSYHFHIEANGVTRYGISTNGIKEAPVTVPPKEEQRAIVQFLDEETTQIDKLIRLEKDLIEKLKEKRLSIIKNSILGKNDSQTQIENNRKDWLDTVPGDWDISKISNIFDVENGSTPKSTEDSYWDGDIAWATPDDLEEETKDYIYSTKRTITKDGLKSCGASLVPENSILMSTRAPIGYVGIAGSEMATNQGCKSLVFKNTNHNEIYFHYQLMASKQEFKSRGMGSTYNELSSRHLKSINLAVPPISEQNEISEYISDQIEEIDESIDKIKSAVYLSYEYRNALITNAVTGQIDVRGEV